MKISVITVTYNSAATIVDTLRSVASQSHEQLEHIVVDGGSTDGTPRLVEEHGRHVAQFVSEPDEGIYDAMNKGLRLARGDFVGFLNADDIFAGPRVVERIAAQATGAHADAVFGDLLYVDKDQPSRTIRHWRSGEFAPARLRFGWMPPHPTFYARRTYLEEVGPFDVRLRIAADYDLMLRCMSRPGFRAVYLPEVLVKMRTGGASNRSFRAMMRKSQEDLLVLRRNEVGGAFSLICKNLRKLPQFLGAGRAPTR